jgi:CheY-like chemotaxis protein
MSMPAMDCFEATKFIRSIERRRGTIQRITIIALAGLVSSQHIAKAYGVCGGHCYSHYGVRSQIINNT